MALSVDVDSAAPPEALPVPARSLATMAPTIVTALVLVAIAAAVLLALAYDRRVRAVSRLLETRAATGALLSSIQDAETGQRGYLLTGEPRYLVPYERATSALPGIRGRRREDQAVRSESRRHPHTWGTVNQEV
jgi:CHASE3 domain sensor protein